MPIYEYECKKCGHAEEVLQKVSDPLLTRCPACGAESFVKKVSAAGFQLKGSGWYVTDFRDKGRSGKPAGEAGASTAKADKAAGEGGDKGSGKAATGSDQAASKASGTSAQGSSKATDKA